jgi:hypothetical protein
MKGRYSQKSSIGWGNLKVFFSRNTGPEKSKLYMKAQNILLN